MKVVRFQEAGGVSWGELRSAVPTAPAAILRVARIEGGDRSTREMIEAFSAFSLKTLDEVEIAASSLLSPVTETDLILCQALNYRDHADESKQSNRKSNLIFTKSGSSITGPFDPIVRPKVVELLDYEVEIGLLLRRDINESTSVSEADIGRYVGGIVLANEVSARDIQFGETFMQWFRGKSFRTFCPLGAVLWLVRPDEVAEILQNLEISLEVNGERRQHAVSSTLIYKPAETLSYISEWMSLRTGTLLLTGTPGGVTAASTPAVVSALKDLLYDDAERTRIVREEGHKNFRPFLLPGDVVTATLKDVRDGSLVSAYRNVIEDEKPR